MRTQRHTSRPALALVALITLVVMVVVAGCGGDDSDAKANEAYATGVCTAIGSWVTEVKSIATDLSGGISQASFEAKITQVEDATSNLATEIKAVPSPDTADGQAAKQQLDQLSTDAQTTVEATKTAITSIQNDASAATIAVAVSVLTPQVKSLASTAEATITALKDAGGGLASAFEDASACQDLTSGS
jgi:hypothetical protein